MPGNETTPAQVSPSSTLEDGPGSTALALVAGVRSGASPEAVRLSVACYIESIASELRAMAGDAGLESLAYFLEMVRIEASLLVTEHAPGALLQGETPRAPG